MNPYDVLGVPRDATKKQINEAFRTKSKAAHPDAGGSAEEFIELKRAHATLSDEVKRKDYDSYGFVDGDNDSNMLRNMALHFIATIFSTILEQDNFGDLRGVDIIRTINEARLDSMRDLVRRKDRADSDLGKAKKQLATIEERMKRKAESGKNVFTDILQQRITGMEAGLKPILQSIAVLQEAEKIVDDYEYAGSEKERDAFADLMQTTFTATGPLWTRRPGT